MTTTGSGARLIIVCGLPGSGKTTRARHLEAQAGAVRLAPDEWMHTLAFDLRDGAARGHVEALQWALARRLMSLGMRVIIEWGTWSRAERDALRDDARALGAAVELHYLSAEPAVLLERVRSRGRETPPITVAEILEWQAAFEEPSEAEMALYDPPLVAADVE